MEDRGWVSGGMTGAGYAGDFTAHGLWGFADTASFGLLDVLNVDDWLWGEDYEVRSMRGDFAGDPSQIDLKTFRIYRSGIKILLAFLKI